MLINTAGFLQTQAQQTGEQSSAQVTDRLEPVSLTGNVTDNETLDKVDLVLQKAPGANDINMSAATVTFVGPDDTLRFEVNDGSVFEYESFQDEDNSVNTSDTANNTDELILNDEADRLVLTMNLTATSHTDLEPGEEAEIRLTGESGATTVIRVSVPNSLSGEKSVTL